MCQLQAYPPIMTPVTPSPDVSPLSAEPTTTAALSHAHYSRAGDAFALNLGTLPDASNFLLKTSLKSPHLPLDSPACFPFSPMSNTFLNGSGNYKKRSRNMSTTSSAERDVQSNMDSQATPHQHSVFSNGTTNGTADVQSSNAKKRPSDGTIDYPRRRATIAVCWLLDPLLRMTDVCSSAKSAARASPAAMATAPSAGSVPSSTPSASTASPASSWMPATS